MINVLPLGICIPSKHCTLCVPTAQTAIPPTSSPMHPPLQHQPPKKASRSLTPPFKSQGANGSQISKFRANSSKPRIAPRKSERKLTHHVCPPSKTPQSTLTPPPSKQYPRDRPQGTTTANKRSKHIQQPPIVNHHSEQTLVAGPPADLPLGPAGLLRRAGLSAQSYTVQVSEWFKQPGNLEPRRPTSREDAGLSGGGKII
ncbi:hypothetical protein B0T14DRAFT_202540 [Immersiella caudata]|uniref:Uncharacterized protein n=1 Tax=Immersiella caudata TaxID=314043 RepID=A0AA40BZ79_9PEZI|nr:hypothetical protein B0T14DRAFT_202540 [Immersiella caudata]